MTPPPLSPAAQAVLDAAERVPWPNKLGYSLIRLETAAAIRAVAEQVAGIAPAGGRAWSEGQAASFAAITAAVRHIQSIADELDSGAPPHTTQTTETTNE